MDTAMNTEFNPMEWLGQPQQVAKSTPVVGKTAAPEPAYNNPHSQAEELEMAKAVTRELTARGANIAESYDDYVRLGFALANGLGSDGCELYHQLCAHSTKYRRQDCERKWQECLRQADGRTTIGTFYHMARQAGVELNSIARRTRNNYNY